MFRHGLRIAFSSNYGQQRKIWLGLKCLNKSNLNRQGKIMSKLFGQKVKGSKKRWYPTTEPTAPSNASGSGLIFKAAQLSRPGGAGKNTTRRTAVLNKLFMEEISSLLATGGIAESLLGRGLQLTRVKISSDFTCVNVYWLGQGDPLKDAELADDLNRCSGLVRHELSQLRVMGEVPRIHFVQDKAMANAEHVETLLRNMDLSNYEDENVEENNIDFQNQFENRVKNEFYGSSKTTANESSLNANETLPPMRQDVFGLDHKNITLKILTKLRKTKQAWEAHSAEQNPVQDLSLLKSVQHKIMEANESCTTDFEKFLAERRERKNTPERKKYRRSDEVFLFNNYEDFEIDAIVPKQLKSYLNEEDYLHEDNNDEKKS